MFYKEPSFRSEDYSNTAQSTLGSSGNFVTEEKLPIYLEKIDFYNIISNYCQNFVESVELENFYGANQIIGEMFQLFYENIEKFLNAKIDLTSIFKIFIDTTFLDSLLSAVKNGEHECVPNCAAFICIMTYISDEFTSILSNEDFIYPLTNYYMEYYKGEALTKDQKWNIVCSINNLIKYYPDKQFSVFFNNEYANFYEIYDAFECSMKLYKILKFFYNVILLADEKLESMYPLFFDYFISKLINLFEINDEDQTDEKIQLFNNTLLLMYRLLKKDPHLITLLFRLEILNSLSTLYIENISILDDCRESYYQMLSLIIKYYDFEDSDLECKKKNIFESIHLCDIIDLLHNENPNIFFDLINNLIEKELFEDLFEGFFEDQAIPLTNSILDLLDESPFNIKKKAMKCLTCLINLHFVDYGEPILQKLETSTICDFIDSNDHLFQQIIFSFLSTVFRQNNLSDSEQAETQRKSFAFKLYEDDDLMDSIYSFSCPLDRELELQATVVCRQICFWVDVPYNS